jgi:ligand-binding sensor domain-containing protein
MHGTLTQKTNMGGHKGLFLVLNIMFVLCLSFLAGNAHGQQLSFERLNNTNGLSQGSVNCIFQDQYGFMWFGTNDGLNKYDGTKFDVYRHNHANKNSLVSGNVSAITEDSTGYLWIGTRGGGLNKFDPLKGECLPFHDTLLPIPSNEIISTLQFYSPDLLLIGTEYNGLYTLNISTLEHKNYRHEENNPQSIAGNSVEKIAISKDKRIFLALATDGYAEFLLDEGTFTNHIVRQDLDPTDSEFQIVTLGFDRQNELWLGDYGKGLYHLIPSTQKLEHFQTREFERPELEADFIRDIIFC